MLEHAPHADAAVVAADGWRLSEQAFVEALAAPLGNASAAIEVYANHGRWVVECPDCHGAQLAHPTDHRFMCNECGNAAVGGAWRPVKWPAKHSEIAEALAARPRENQNWIPGETLKRLRAENREQMGAA